MKGTITRLHLLHPLDCSNFNVMHAIIIFGLQGAPATFQHLMDHVLTNMGGFAAAYVPG